MMLEISKMLTVRCFFCRYNWRNILKSGSVLLKHCMIPTECLCACVRVCASMQLGSPVAVTKSANMVVPVRYRPIIFLIPTSISAPTEAGYAIRASDLSSTVRSQYGAVSCVLSDSSKSPLQFNLLFLLWLVGNPMQHMRTEICTALKCKLWVSLMQRHADRTD